MRALVTSTPGMGHLNSVIPLASALRDAGHEILFVTPEESRDTVEGHGFSVRPGGISAAARRAALSPHQAEVRALPPRQRRGMLFSIMFAEAAAPAMHVELAPIVDDYRPDVMIHETGELAAAPIATARGIPHVTVAFSGMLPAWSHDMVMASVAPIWLDEGLDAPTYDDMLGHLYLHPFPPSFGQAPAAPVVRAMRAVPVATMDEPPSWLTKLGADRPLVYVTSGTEPAAMGAPWSAMIEAVGSFDVDAVATIGKHVDPATLGAIPPNVRVERFVPQHFVLDRATVVMSHAGAGSLLGAAANGVPQLLNPIWADQWQNADAASESGVGITCDLDQRSAAEIGDRLERLLHDAEFKQAAARVATEVEAMPSPVDHVVTIAALAGGSSS